MRLLVIGSTGGTGRALVEEALRRGHEVTAFARRPGKVKVGHERLTIAEGNVLDLASLDAAVRGQDAVLCALGHKRWLYPNRILSDGTRNLVAAMESHGVRRLVCETSLGIGDSYGRMGLYYTLFVGVFILPFYFYDKTRQERVVRASNLEWVIVRPGQLTNGRKRGTCRHGERIGSWIWTVSISRRDVAAFMLDQVTEDRYLRRAVGICR